MSLAVRLIGVVPLAVAGVPVLVELIRTWPPRLSRHALRMQRVATVTELGTTVGDLGDPRREQQRRELRVDFGFIAFYLGLFVALAVLLAQRDGAEWTVFGAAAATAAAATAGCDVAENLLTFRGLRTPLVDTTQRMVDAMRTATRVKWALVAVTVALLSTLFWGDRAAAALAFGALWVAVAGVGVLAFFRRALLPVFFEADILTLLATLVFFAACPATFLQGY